MGASTKYAIPYPEQTDPADVPTDIKDVADRLEIILTGRYRGYLTVAQFGALTGNADGDLVDVIVDAASGIVWRFRYNAGSASAFKWEFVGGPPLAVDQTGGDTVTASATYTDGGIALPALPRAGDYDVLFGCQTYFSGTVAWTGFTTLKLGAAAAADGQASVISSANPASATSQGVVGRMFRLTGRAAGDVLSLWHKVTGGQAVGFGARWIRATPVRIS